MKLLLLIALVASTALLARSPAGEAAISAAKRWIPGRKKPKIAQEAKVNEGSIGLPLALERSGAIHRTAEVLSTSPLIAASLPVPTPVASPPPSVAGDAPSVGCTAGDLVQIVHRTVDASSSAAPAAPIAPSLTVPTSVAPPPPSVAGDAPSGGSTAGDVLQIASSSSSSLATPIATLTSSLASWISSPVDDLPAGSSPALSPVDALPVGIAGSPLLPGGDLLQIVPCTQASSSSAGSLIGWMRRFRMKIRAGMITLLVEVRFSTSGVSYLIAVLVRGGEAEQPREPTILMIEPAAPVLAGTLHIEIAPLELRIGKMAVGAAHEERRYIVFAPLPASLNELSIHLKMLFEVVAIPHEFLKDEYHFQPVDVKLALFVDPPFLFENGAYVCWVHAQLDPYEYYRDAVRANKSGRLFRPWTRLLPNGNLGLAFTCPLKSLITILEGGG